jgi:hypothetical protein
MGGGGNVTTNGVEGGHGRKKKEVDDTSDTVHWFIDISLFSIYLNVFHLFKS